MSIQDFHSQLTQDVQPDALMATLRRLAQADDRQVVEQLAIDPMGEWGLWTSGLAGE
jgi:hypothetical protein